MNPDKISATARIIAASTLLLEGEGAAAEVRPAPGAAALCERLLSATPGGRLWAASVKSPSGRWLWRLLERMTHPGIISHYWRRKHRIEAQVRAAIHDGVSRVVILGAGFDTLGWRLSEEFGDVEFIEVDLPGIADVKFRVLSAESSRTNFSIVNRDTPARMGAPDVRTLVVVEGVLMYFDAAAIDAFWTRLREESGGGLAVVFTFMERYPDGGCGFRPRSRLVDHWLRITGEPFLWSCSSDSLRGFLKARGMELVSLESPTDESGKTGLTGENLAVAKVVRDEVVIG